MECPRCGGVTLELLGLFGQGDGQRAMLGCKACRNVFIRRSSQVLAEFPAVERMPTLEAAHRARQFVQAGAPPA